MKFLILLVCLGFVAADLHKRAALLVEDAVLAFKEGFGETGSLRRALGMPEAVELDEVEDDVKQDLVKKMKEAFDELLEKVIHKMENGKDVAQDTWEKLKEYREKMKDLKKGIGEKGKELIEKLKEKVKELLKNIVDKSDKRNLDEEYDVLARSKFTDIIERIKAKILSNENIRKIREYIKNFVTNKPGLQDIKEFLLKLKEINLKQLILDLFGRRRENRGIKEMWEKFKDFLKEKHKDIGEKFAKVKDWLKDKIGSTLGKIKDKHEMIKEVAKEIMTHAKDLTTEVSREALEMFRPYKEDLGALWKQLVETLKEHIGSF